MVLNPTMSGGNLDNLKQAMGMSGGSATAAMEMTGGGIADVLGMGMAGGRRRRRRRRHTGGNKAGPLNPAPVSAQAGGRRRHRRTAKGRRSSKRRGSKSRRTRRK